MGALGAVCALLSAMLRRESPAMGFGIALCACVAAIFLLESPLRQTVETAQRLAGRGNVSPTVVSAIWKTTAIALISRVTAAFCRDAGDSAAASTVDTAGCVCALCAALPLMESVLDLVEDML